MRIDLLGFLCESFTVNNNVYKLIDDLYQKKKYDFYEISRSNELYTHPLITEGSLLQEEYRKKILGILLYQAQNQEDFEIAEDFNNLVKTAFPYVYTYLNQISELSVSNFMKKFIKKNKGIANLTEDEISANLTAVIVMALSEGVPTKKDDAYNNIMQIFFDRLEHYKSDNRLQIEAATAQEMNKINELRSTIIRELGKVKDFPTLLEVLNGKPENERFSMLFDTENVTSSIFYDVTFTPKDFDEILLIYIRLTENIENNDLKYYFISSIYIKYLLKSYKLVKKQYFKNNKETQFAELAEKEREIIKLKSKWIHEEQKNREMVEEIDALTKKVEKMKNELDDERLKDKELNSLRTFMFKLDEKKEFESEKVDLKLIKSLKAVIIGGHENWQEKMKQFLPECAFVHTDMLNFDLKTLDNIKTVFIYTNYLNHGMYYRVMNYIKGTDITVHYLSQQNTELVLQQIYERTGNRSI